MPLVVTGTAGSGKSTCLIKLGLRLAGEGVATFWMDKRWNVEPYRLRELVAHSDGPIAILVDDADIFGRSLSAWARELPQWRPGVLFVPALRSHRVDGLLDVQTLGGINPREVVMPHLTDADIAGLLELLDRHNQLGILKGKSEKERVEAFRNESGRQLLVAMIQATSGKQLRQKVFDEFRGLGEPQRLVYAMICLVHSHRHDLGQDELLLATGRPDNETLDAMNTLVRRHLVVRQDAYRGYKARHRMIADELVTAAEFRPYYAELLRGLAFAFATQVRPEMDRYARPWKKLIRFISHAYIRRVVSLEDGRACYADLEGLLSWDFHYWLQRGSLEVEDGDLDLASRFLDQARSLAPTERNVETEYAYFLTKKAARNPENPSSHEWFNEGRQSLEEQIQLSGKYDPYPYHVLGTQGLAWARRGNLTKLEKRELLGQLLQKLREGVAAHPRAEEVKTIRSDVEKEWLLTAVGS